MALLHKLTKLLQVSLIILVFLFLGFTHAAYARGGCFGSGTEILTSDGHKPIEELHAGDRVVGYNFTTHQREEGEIGEIQIISSPDFYLINKKINVTGTHPFYVKLPTGIKLIEVQYLKEDNQLLDEKGSAFVISSIEHIKQPIKVFNLISINPNHNFYADKALVHNKGGGGSIGSRGYSYKGGSGYGSVPINSKTIPGLILISLAFLIVPLFFFWREIYNSIRFFKKEFTNDPELIEFVKTINSDFSNHYSMNYFENNERWNIIPLQSDLEIQDYQYLISRTDLIEQVSHLFIRYQQDWTRKNFAQMEEYISEPFLSKQSNIFLYNFGDNFDIVYKPELLEALPVSYEQKQDKHIILIQINASMVNFEISAQGYVLSGEAHSRTFTEYWNIGIDNARKIYLLGISQISLP